jgi:hypothetical protein
MSIRVTTSILGILSIGLIVTPADGIARGFGGGGRAAPVSGLHGLPARPAVVAPPALVRPLPAASHPRIHAVAPFVRGHHRRFIRNGAGWWSYPAYGYDDDVPYQQPIYPDPATAYPGSAAPPDAYPPDGYPPAAYPPAAAPERAIYVVRVRPSCSTQTYRVRSEKGGQRSIDVVRC